MTSQKADRLDYTDTIDFRSKPVPSWVQAVIEAHLAIEEEDARSAGQLGFMARALVIATMPYKDPKTVEFTRRNGDFRLRILAGYEGGIPFGIYPRLLLSWVATEAVRTQEPVIELGDTLIGEKHSFGYEWQAVELESPLKPMFNKNGDPSQYLNHAIRQIQDWRTWLLANQSYASRPKSEQGLGLTHINGNVRGLILISRRSTLPQGTIERRRQMAHELNIRIHTYDYLVEALKGRLKGQSLWAGQPIDGEA